MNVQTQIFLALFLCPVLYFFVKFIKAKKTATAGNNHEFNFWYFIKNDSLDIIAAFTLCAVVYITKDGHGLLTVDLSSPSKAFATGMTICTVTVGIVLSMLGIGDKTARKTRKVIDVKTNFADRNHRP